jgi:hypothetical protein
MSYWGIPDLDNFGRFQFLPSYVKIYYPSHHLPVEDRGTMQSLLNLHTKCLVLEPIFPP